MSEEADAVGHTHELVVPFVVVKSAGGPYDDDAYVAGYECAFAHQLIANDAEVIYSGFVVHTANLPQIDLLAMHHGYTMHAADTEDPSWSVVVFDPVTKLQETL